MFTAKTPYTQSKHVGLSLETYALRAIAVDNQNRILEKVEVVVDEPFFTSDHCNGRLLVESLNKLKQIGHIESGYISLCLPEKYAFSRQHTLPKIKETEIDEAISWQTETIFPFAKDEVYTDWRILTETPTETKVHVVAIPVLILDQIKNACEAAGLYPIGFEPSALALGRLTRFEKGEGILVELNRGGSSCTAVSQGISLLTSTTFFGDNSDPQAVLTDLIGSIQSLEPQFADKNYSIALTGEKASPQIAALLKEKIGREVEVLNIGAIEPAFHTAFAVATAMVKPPSSTQTINVLPQKLKEYYEVKIAYETAKANLSLIAACIAIAVAGFLGLTGFLEWKVAAATSQKLVAPLENPATAGELSPQLLIGTAQRLNLLFPKKVGPEAAVAGILENTPTGVVITRLQFDKTKSSLTLTGQAKTRDLLLSYRDTLTKIDTVSKVVLPLASLEVEENPTFTMEIILKPKTP